jgi:hypothetical protein
MAPISGACMLSSSIETRASRLRWCPRRRNLAIAAATTSATTLPTTAPTIMGVLELCVEPADAGVVVCDGTEVVALVVPLELEVVLVVLVVLLQWVYMLLFVAASSLTPVLMVYTLKFVL